ncbi:MAG TPA: phosphopantothenoylcysteine decarboxylase [Candidatus Paceibacterota bacterium]|nr:phosphopantothenoylcysteine decarboxylase [Verrucomicrobiota bacterium]HSA11665.1 phosphopantothenoylcysteine decarboxylase [Candidatus Paceibacterota bacterium]
MRCIVTAGPTFEPLDAVRRLTNFSTGRLGSELCNFLSARGHDVTLLIGQQAPWRGERRARRIETFTTTANLRECLQALAHPAVDVVFHAAAVSDFSFGKVWCQPPEGARTEVKGGKFPSRDGTLLAELVPTPKIIADLRQWFPKARLVGWKYEVEGDRAGVIRRAEQQIADCRTDACVANGAAYGEGFGLVQPDGQCTHLPDLAALFAALERFIGARSAGPK